MGSRTFNTVVVVFWLATMSWLLKEKVLPPLQVGEPPNYGSIVRRSELNHPVCWGIRLNGRQLGWAVSCVVPREDGMTELHSRVFFERLPVDELAPGWLGAFVRPVLDRSGKLDMEAKSRLAIDPLGRLVNFESRLRMANLHDAIRVQGHVEGMRLKLSAQSGTFEYKTDRYLPPEALVGDLLSPQVRLPGLRLGQRWTMPVYSPFRPPNNPMEILQASVDRSEVMRWDHNPVQTLVVTYRSDSGSALTLASENRGKLWVKQDGLVLRQEMSLFNSRLEFIRLPGTHEDLGTLGKGDDWSEEMSKTRARDISRRLHLSH